MRFHWADYVVYSLAVAGSTAIGLYHGFTRRKNAGIDDYLMAGRRMPILPVSLSQYMSWLSAISILSDPVDVYYHGLIYWVIGVGYALAMPVTGAIFVPRFHRMKLTSVFKVLSLSMQYLAVVNALKPLTIVLHCCNVSQKYGAHPLAKLKYATVRHAKLLQGYGFANLKRP